MIGFTIATTIHGIPCQAEILFYQEEIRNHSGATSFPYEGTPEVIEFQLLTPEGIPTEPCSVLTNVERDRIIKELSAALHEWNKTL